MMHPPFSMLTKNAYFFTRPKLCLTVFYLKSRPAVCPHSCPLVLPLTSFKKRIYAVVARFLLSYLLFSTDSPGLVNTNLLPSLFYTSPSCFAILSDACPTFPFYHPLQSTSARIPTEFKVKYVPSLASAVFTYSFV